MLIDDRHIIGWHKLEKLKRFGILLINIVDDFDRMP
jgi:hypothetical protein